MIIYLENWNQKFEHYGIVVKELIKNINGKDYDATIQYLHTNRIIKITKLAKFLSNYKKHFKLHKDVLENTKQYKDTYYYVSQYGDVYTTKGVTKKLIPQIKCNSFYFDLDKKIQLNRLMIDVWGHEPLPRLLIEHKELIQELQQTTLKNKHMSLDELTKQLELLGIIVKETYPIGNGKYEATINYLHTNVSRKILEVRTFFTDYKKNFKLHKDILKDTKQYKNTHLFVSKNGEVYSVNGVVKLLNPVINKHRSKSGYIKLNTNQTPVHHMVLEAWGFPRPSLDHIVRHLNDIPNDNRLDNLKWDFQLVNMKDKEINEDKRKELIKSLFKANLFSIEELSILTKIKLDSIEGIIKTF